MGTHKFIQQTEISPAVQNSPYIRRLQKALFRKSIEYQPRTETTNDIPEIETLEFAKRYPESVVKNIGWLYRVKLPKPGMFELNEDTGELDREHKVKQALAYHLNCYVTDPNTEGGRAITGFARTEGVYRDIIPEYKYDRSGKKTGYTAVGNRNIFYIEYTPENVDKILDEMSNLPNATGVCVGAEQGHSPWINNPYKVHNFDEFRNIDDIDGLIAANIGTKERGTFLRADYGGYEDYKEWLSQRPKRQYTPPSGTELKKGYPKKE